MPLYYASGMRFECPNCKRPNEQVVRVPETYWSGDNADERFVEDEQEVACGACGHEMMFLVQNSDGRVFVDVALPDDEVKVVASDAHLHGQFDLFDVPGRPGSVLAETLDDVQQVLGSASLWTGQPTLFRMAFIQQFAALEAYLGDTLTGQVLNKQGALSRLVDGDRDLKKVNLPLSAALQGADFVRQTAVAHLQESILYHNLAKVEAIWRLTLGFSLFPDAALRERLERAVPIRHDCVHRNGKKKSGGVRNEVNKHFVEQMHRDMLTLMKHVEARLEGVD